MAYVVNIHENVSYDVLKQFATKIYEADRKNHTVVGTFWAGTDDAKVLVILTKNTDMQQDPEQNSKLHRRSAEHVRKHVEGAANDFEKPDKQATSIALKHDLMAWMSDLAQQDRAMLDNLVAGLKGEVKGLGINRPNFQHVDPTAPNTWLKKLYDAFSEGHFQKLNGAYNNIETAMAHLLDIVAAPGEHMQQLAEAEREKASMQQQPEVEAQLQQQPEVEAQLQQQPEVEAQLQQQPEVEAQLQQQQDETKREKARLQQKLADAEREKARLQQQLAETEASMQLKLAEADARLQLKLTEARLQQQDEAEREKARLQQKLDEAEHEKARLQRKLAETEARLQQQQKLDEAEHEKAKLQQKLAETEARLQQQQQHDEAEREKARLQQQLADTEARLQQQQVEAKREKARLQQKHTVQLARSMQQLAASQGKEQELQKQVEKLQAKQEDLKEELGKWKAEAAKHSSLLDKFDKLEATVMTQALQAEEKANEACQAIEAAGVLARDLPGCGGVAADLGRKRRRGA